MGDKPQVTATAILQFQARWQKSNKTAGEFKGLGIELRDRFGLTDREAIDLLNDRNVVEILAKYEKAQVPGEAKSRTCPRCGNSEIEPGHRYCKICGLPLGEDEKHAISD